MTEQYQIPPLDKQRLTSVLFDSIVPFSLGIFFASAIFLYGYYEFAQIISAAISKSCGVK